MKLFTGDRNYSSWSLRPWFALKAAGLEFEDCCEELSGTGINYAKHAHFSPSGLAPCLHDLVEGKPVVVWDSLAIVEYVYERLAAEQKHRVWPDDLVARTFARCIVAEMHSGFPDLRNALPMNIKLELEGRDLSGKVLEQMQRINRIWEECLQRWGGPYLFGAAPTAADAFYAPVVFRVNTYNVAPTLTRLSQGYVATMLADPISREWAAAARAEKSALTHYDAEAVAMGGALRSAAAAAAGTA